MENKNKIIIGISVLVLAVALVLVFRFTGNVVQNSELDDFAKYLTKSGAKMYGTEWCSYCKKQKELFGSSFDYVDYVDCDKKKAECTLAGVTGYPTWVVYGESYPGVQPIERLASLVGYKK